MHMLCKYYTFVHHPHLLGYPCAKFCFIRNFHCFAHWAEIYGWPQHWVALNETTHPEGTKLTSIAKLADGEKLRTQSRNQSFTQLI